MKVTDILFEEHQIINRMLACLEKAARILERGEEIRPGYFIDISNFCREYIESGHQKFEENILFEAMMKSGLSRNNRSMTVVILEHEQSRLYAHRMGSAAEKWLKGDLSARKNIIDNAFGYIDLIRIHLLYEEKKIYPMAENLIPLNAQQDIWEVLEKVMGKYFEKGHREKLYNLIDKLEAEIS